jgi:hypothetical protein
MHDHVTEQEAEGIITDWLRVHEYHKGSYVLERGYSVIMECPECGPKVFQTISKKNGAYELAFACYRPASRLVR